MGKNEMKPKHGLPCGVRLIAGLGGAGGTTALALAAETVAEPERRATLCIVVVFTTSSVPELSLVRHRFTRQSGVVFPAVGVLELRKNETDLRATSGVVLCCRRAARRRTGSHHEAHALAVSRAKDGAANRGGGSMQYRASGEEFGDEQRTSGPDRRYSLCLE